jgi:hypothetical protein
MYPEEVVFSCILAKPEYADVGCTWHNAGKLFINSGYCSIEGARNHGFYFVQRNY